MTTHRRLASFVVASVIACSLGGPLIAQTPTTPQPAATTKPTEFIRVPIELKSLSGSLAILIAVDMPNVDLTRGEYDGHDSLILSGTPSAVLEAERRLKAIDAAFVANEKSVDVALKRLSTIDAVNAVRMAGVSPTALTQANIVVLRGQPYALDEAVKRLAELDAQVNQKWEEEQAQRKQALEVQTRVDQEQQFVVAALSLQNSVTISFAGGTVGDYLKKISESLRQVGAQMKEPNVILSNDAIAALRMPSVALQSVTATAAIMLLQTLPFERDGSAVTLQVDEIPGDPDGIGIDSQSIQVVKMFTTSGAPITPKAVPMRTEVFSLGVVQRNDPTMLKGLLDAITTGVELNGKSLSFSMKFHEGSGLLFVRGTSEDIGMVKRVVFTAMPSEGSGK